MDGSDNRLCARCTYLVQTFHKGLTSTLAYRFYVALSLSALENSAANSCQLCGVFWASILEDFTSTSLTTLRSNDTPVFLAETRRESSRFHTLYLEIGYAQGFRTHVNIFTLDRSVEELTRKLNLREILLNPAHLEAFFMAGAYRKEPTPKITSGEHCVEDDEPSAEEGSDQRSNEAGRHEQIGGGGSSDEGDHGESHDDTRSLVLHGHDSHEHDTPNPYHNQMVHNICTAQGLEAVATQARRWLAKCTTEHSKCSAQQDRIGGLPPLPTRVLDVGTDDEPSLCLFVAPGGRRAEYVALSYCWGNGVQVKMTKTTLDNMQQEILLSTLPKTIQDSIVFTRKLGVRYLWVDVLCIIQAESSHDEHHMLDWQREAARFGDYYQNALCTLAATASHSVSDGLFYPCYGRYPKYMSTRQGPNNASVHVWIPRGRPDSLLLTNSPLYRRGWAVQERILSPRIIYFTEKLRIWECGDSWASEEYPDTNLRPNYYRASDSMASIRYDLMERDVESLRGMWLRFCKHYSEKKFTRFSDRLPALSGVARRIQTLTGAKYYAGVWDGQLISSLSWYQEEWESGTYLEKPANGAGPSWSWAIMAHGSFDNFAAGGYVGYGGTLVADKKLTILDVQVDYLGRDTDGLVRAGTLTLEGDLSTLDVGKWGYQRHAKSSHIWIRNEERVYLYWGWAGTDDEVLRTHVCLQIGTVKEWTGMYPRPKLIGAVFLDPTTAEQEGPATYKRVGFGFVPEPIWELGERKRGTVNIV